LIIETESGVAGKAYIDILVKQDSGSRDIIFTVLSMKPTAKNLHRFLPSGTSPISIDIISDSYILDSHSLSALEISSSSKYTICPPSIVMTT
jgi:hypothetical protein